MSLANMIREGGSDESRDFTVDVLRRIIALPTEVPPGSNYGRAIDVVSELCDELELQTRVVDVPDEEVKALGLDGNRVNLVASRGDSDIVMNGHIDVVPAGGGWSVDPFMGVAKEGFMYGRGAADNKGGVVAILLATKLLTDTFGRKVPLTMAVTVDEEIGGELGLGYLLRRGFLHARHFLSSDGYSDSIVFCHNGIYRFNLSVKGKAAHASTPFKGLNAIVKAAKVISEMDGYAATLKSRTSAYPSTPELQRLGLHRLFATLNIGVIRGGTKVNIVPDQCVMEVERRFIPEESVDEVRSEIRLVVEKLISEGSDVQLRDVSVRTSAFSDPESEVVKSVREACKLVYGGERPLAGMTGATDASHVTTYLRAPFAIHGPIGQESRIHEPDERVRIQDVLDVAKVFAVSVARLTGYR